MSNTSKIIDKFEDNVIHTYTRYNVAIESGDGVYLTDADGKKYLDFGSGIGVYALGYNNKEYNDALKAQIDKIVHTSNMFYTSVAADAAEKICKVAGMDKVFFTNSGTEANEGALKLAKKYGYLKDGKNDHEIIAMEHSFHGRSMGSLSVTGTPKYREAFGPLIPGIKFVNFNDLDAVKAAVTDKTCAIMFETLQGEGGIHPATKEFMEGVRKICDEKDILMILDEVQCGMGRTGKMFAFQNYDVKPDVITSAKALSCGIPMGAFITNEKASKVLVAGDHGTTYGGNPLACAASLKVLELFNKNKILENVNDTGMYLYKKLDEIAGKYDIIKEHRGMGLMQGLEFTVPVRAIIDKALENGLILFAAGANVIRFLPPLIISKTDVDEMISKLEKCL